MQADKSEIESAEQLVEHMKNFARAGHQEQSR